MRIETTDTSETQSSCCATGSLEHQPGSAIPVTSANPVSAESTQGCCAAKDSHHLPETRSTETEAATTSCCG